jgi:hypothetical protein
MYLFEEDGDKKAAHRRTTWRNKKENVMKITNLILSAMLLLFAAGCSQSGNESSNNASITNAPAATNSPTITNK